MCMTCCVNPLWLHAQCTIMLERMIPNFQIHDIFQLILCNVVGIKGPDMHIKSIRIIFLTFPCFTNVKINESMVWQVIFGATANFSLLLDVHDLLTFDDLISILICIMIDLMNRVCKYKHFKGSFVVLWYILPKIQWFMFPLTPKFWFRKGMVGSDFWHHFLSSYRVTSLITTMNKSTQSHTYLQLNVHVPTYIVLNSKAQCSHTESLDNIRTVLVRVLAGICTLSSTFKIEHERDILMVIIHGKLHINSIHNFLSYHDLQTHGRRRKHKLLQVHWQRYMW